MHSAGHPYARHVWAGAAAKTFSDGVQLPVVIITGYADVETAVRTLKRGAFDFLEKPIEAEKLDAVLENCWNRWNVKNSGQSPQKIAAIFHEMSEREKGIVRLLVQELTSKQIGDRLGLSERTVQGHRLNLYKNSECIPAMNCCLA